MSLSVRESVTEICLFNCISDSLKYKLLLLPTVILITKSVICSVLNIDGLCIGRDNGIKC